MLFQSNPQEHQLSNVSFDPAFKKIRERKSKFKIDKDKKRALENSIQRANKLIKP